MPRKTKEPKSVEAEELEVKKTTTKKAKKVANPSKDTKSKTDTKVTKKAEKNEPKNTTKKKVPTTKPTSTKSTTAKSTSKKATTKKVTAKKSETLKKSATKASSATKKANTATNKASTTAKKANTTNKKTATATKKSTSTTKKVASAKKSSKESTNKRTTKKTTSQKAKKTSTNSVSVVEYYDLPYRYNQTVVRVLAQTPTNLFVYWDISDDDRKNYIEQYGEHFFETTKPVLIVHNNTYNYSFEIDINDFANSWYLSVKDAKCDYKVELGRRPISYNEKINTDYIYITTSNNIEAPNNQVLLDHNQKMVYFKNVKNGIRTSRPISTFSFLQNKGKFYSAYEWFQKLYPNETEDFSNLSNPSSGNPSSGSLSSKFK